MFWHLGDGLTHTRDHWAARSDWAGGRRQFTFHLLFDGTGLAEATGSIRDACASVPAFDPVPPAWLHLTLTPLGFTDAVGSDAAGAVADEVAAGLDPVAARRDHLGELVFDTLLLGAEGPLLCPRPTARLDEVVRLQRDAVDRHLGARGWRAFLPHVSVAYANAVIPLESTADVVGPAAEATAPISVRPRMALVEQGIIDRAYRWRVVRMVG